MVTDGETRLRLAEDREGQQLWPTTAERAAAQVASLEAEVAAMRDELARLRRGG